MPPPFPDRLAVFWFMLQAQGQATRAPYGAMGSYARLCAA
jgi:hypothetical protein